MDNLIPILVAAVAAGTPMVFAALGELVTEKSGVLNLGVEGMMLMGAVTGFAVAASTGNPWLGAVGGMAAGAAMALIFAVLTLNLMANQVASGLALTLFGVGLSAFLGKPYESVSLTVAPPPAIPLLSQIPVLGPLLFNYHLLVYVSWVLFAAIAWFLYKSRAGLVLRSIGESPESAHAIGYPVIRIRYLATLFGGAMAGLGGAYLSEFYAPLWVEGMTAGRGWIALALVVFATWRPARVMIGAYLFGGVTIAQFFAQGAGISIASQFLSSLPYLATIVVLVFISRNLATIRLNAPVSLAKSYRPD
ncbi:MAG TPA: ABC transporter permease [Casimicrobiaceae bacterium]|jgi:simple sugar transport system permease protein